MSSSSDSDVIEIDGFPPELANNARFTSLKSNCDSVTNQKIYLPITSWSSEILPAEIIKICLRILKDSTSLSENERRQIMDQLESQMCHSTDSLNSDTEWCSKSSLSYTRPHNVRNESNKSPSLKVKIEIPSSNANLNNIKYYLEKPIYDADRHCWKTSMDFILQTENQAISESAHEIFQDNKETQTDFELPRKKTSLPLIFVTEPRSKSEERLAFCAEDLSNPLNNNAEISVLENLEICFESLNKSSTLNESFRKYKIIIRKTIEKYKREVKKLQTQAESINVQFYNKMTETQFKTNSRNSLYLTDVEQELEFLNSKLNLKVENANRILKTCEKPDGFNQEIQNTKFSQTIRLISQMLSTVRNQIASLNKELNMKNKAPFFNLK